jgi:uncharacterized protein (TIGR03118 family)
MKSFSLSLAIACALLAAWPSAAQNRYLETKLVADQSGVAAFTDPKLINAWGMDHAPGGPWFVTATDSGFSLAYDGTGAPYPSGNPTVISVPAPGNAGAGAPTSVVYNGTSDFQLAPGMPATYLFATEDGTIAGWNPNVDATHAILKVTGNNAIYKGMTMGQHNGHNVLFAANFFNGSVDVFDGNFNPVTLPPGAFQNSAVPSGFAPFNVQSIGGLIYVAWAKQNRKKTQDVPGAGNGYLAAFTPDGSLVLQFEHNNTLNSPWGFAMAPASGFGDFSGLLLVTQFAGGTIAGFNPATGAFHGVMNGTSGRQIRIPGIWAIDFGDGGLTGPATSLYFAAGTQLERHGLFGSFTFQP